MVNKLLDILYPYSNGTIVAPQELSHVIEERYKDKYKLDIINDARSATFYAFGKSKNSFMPTILIMDSKGVASAYTGLTEANYQKIPVILIELSLFNTDDFLDLCVIKQFEIRNGTDFKNVMDVFTKQFERLKFGPIVFKLPVDYAENKMKLDEKLLSHFSTVLKDKDTLLVSDLLTDCNYKANYNLFVESDCIYGVISKYYGYVLRASNQVILVCTSQCAYLDINIFNCRYVSDKLKIIIFEKSGYQIDIKNWIKANGITYENYNHIDDRIVEKFVNSNKPIVLYICEDK